MREKKNERMRMKMKIRQTEKEEKNFLAKYQSLTISIETINLVLLTLLAKNYNKN